MGQCLGALGGAGATPEVPFEEVAAKTKELLEPMPEKYQEALDNVTKEYEAHMSKSPNDIFEAKTTDRKTKKPAIVGKVAAGLAKDAAEKQLKDIAGKILTMGEFTGKIAEEVWGQVEPKIEEQKPEGTPDMVWNKGKGAVQGKVEDEVAKQVTVAVDKLIAAKQAQMG
mmetsp:Transcript_3399/g.8096  ORF Transcript_3399/g.8096 Transcript_3399/m.8096 type:complete len:169 (+) Transcript_3399:66-572(+)|eukprot:2179778-Rhodomonas_salina.1